MDDSTKMTARRPYLVRAFYEWLLDNQLTPHLVVDVSMPGVCVPMEFAQDGQIILNIAPLAVSDLELGNDEISFNARFSGVSRHVRVPLSAVLALYARENGAGTMFEPEPYYLQSAVQQDAYEFSNKGEASIHLVSDDDTPGNATADHSDNNEPTPPRGRPALRVVK